MPTISFLNMVKALGTFAGTQSKSTETIEDEYDPKGERIPIYTSNKGRAMLNFGV